MRFRSPVALMVSSLAAGLVFAPVTELPAQAAQDVKYTTVTKQEFGGRLGRVMRLFGGGKSKTETYWYSGHRLRTDVDKTSQVVDARAGTMMTMEHEPKTYWLWSDSEPMLVVEVLPDEEGADSIKPTRRRAKAKYSVTLNTERTGQRQPIVGLDAEQVIVTMRIDGETYNEEADSTEKGSFVVLSEVWLTPKFPGTAAERAFNDAWAARTTRNLDSAEVAQAAKAMEQAYAEEPRLRIAVQKLDSTLATLDGYSLKTFSHYVIVPDGAEFDREKVIRDADKSLLGDIASSAAASAVNRGRERLGRMAGGRLGGGNRAPKAEQAVIMRTRYEVTELATSPIPADKYVPPANYKRRTPGAGK